MPTVIEPDFLRTTQEAYDSVAADYAERFSGTLSSRPLERAMLSAFAEIVQATGASNAAGTGDDLVADLGCGPGYITAHLHGLGLPAFGVDLSPTMIALAREAYPHLRFDVGSMTALDIADGSLSGIVSRASIIHTPPEFVPEVLAEFHRVLAPGGHLLLSVLGSDDPSRPTQFYDHTVSAAYRWSPDHLAGLLRDAGLVEVARLIQEPEPTDKRQFPVVQLLGRKA